MHPTKLELEEMKFLTPILDSLSYFVFFMVRVLRRVQGRSRKKMLGGGDREAGLRPKRTRRGLQRIMVPFPYIASSIRMEEIQPSLHLASKITLSSFIRGHCAGAKRSLSHEQ